jgi:UDP-2-acetamido-3-amino-2,3-dideoxy-glucuronate N-acetyltransferase
MTRLLEINGVKIHPSAEVSENAIIGKGTYVWNQVQVREKCRIGNNCILSKDVYIDFDVVIGNNVKIQNGVSVYHGVVVEDDVFLGPHMVFTNDLYPRSYIGDFKVYKTIIKKGASIGANSTIICGTTIGEYSLIGAGSVITKDVPAHALVIGNPGRIVGFVGKLGKKLIKVETTKEAVIMKCPESGEIVNIPIAAYKLMK